MGDAESARILHIFTREGATFTFHSVTVKVDNETILRFVYTANSDGATKVGTFLKDNIAGYSFA